jgi:hypothetical protein
VAEIIIDAAKQKMKKATGSDVNYYLIEVLHPKFGVVCVVEVEDIIEFLDMRFAEANVFKALVRLAKLRQDLGKPGSSHMYEAEKIVYYSARTSAKAQKRKRAKTIEQLQNLQVVEVDPIIRVTEPKRLAPYEVHISDINAALDLTDVEKEIMSSLYTAAWCIKNHDLTYNELESAEALESSSKVLLEEVKKIYG